MSTKEDIESFQRIYDESVAQLEEANAEIRNISNELYKEQREARNLSHVVVSNLKKLNKALDDYEL